MSRERDKALLVAFAQYYEGFREHGRGIAEAVATFLQYYQPVPPELDALEAYERAKRLVKEWAGTDDPTVATCANELMDALGYN